MSKPWPASNASDLPEPSSDSEHDSEHDGAVKKRRRTVSEHPVSVSCETCKHRKVKCDRARPACGWCLKNGQYCEYKERKKPGLRAGYGRELEARMAEQATAIEELRQSIERHELAIAQIQTESLYSVPLSLRHGNGPAFRPTSRGTPQLLPTEASSSAQHTSHSPSTTSIPQASERHVQSISRNGNYRPHVAADGLDVHRLAAQPTVTPNLHEQPQPALQSSSLDLPNTRSRMRPASMTETHSHEFPEHDLCSTLIDLFFRHVNVWCPILHRGSTMDLLFGSMPLQEEEKVLLHAIIATTIRFCTDQRLTDDSRQRQHSISKEKVQLYGMDHSSVRALQALTILTLDCVGDSNGPPGWNMLALISRQVVQLGLSVETGSPSIAPSIYTLRAMILPEPQDFIEEESRRRLFWTIYLLDRFATISTAFGFALNEKDMDRRLPCHEGLMNNKRHVQTRWFRSARGLHAADDGVENLGAYSYYIEVVGILSQIHLFLKEPVDISALSDVEKWQRRYRELDSELETWKYQLPPEYSDLSRVYECNVKGKPIEHCWVMLHAAYFTTVIRLHSSAAYPTTRSPIFTPSYSAAQRCQTAAENVVALCNFVRTAKMLPELGPPFAFFVWVAARVLLVHGCTVARRVSQSIYPMVEGLRELGAYWKVAERYAVLLQRVLDEYQESEHAPGTEIPNTVKILADMRRTAFDLDSLISRAPKIQQDARRMQSGVVPVRSAAPPADLEYLDVFDFFNMPRLPAHPAYADQGMGAASAEKATQRAPRAADVDSMRTASFNDFNINNFMFDTDWLGQS